MIKVDRDSHPVDRIDSRGISRRALLRSGALAILAAGGVSACGQSFPPLSSPTDRSAAATLHLNLGAEPDTIDPARASFTGEIEVVMRVFSNLYTTDRQARLVPDQADGMPSVSPDGKTIVVRLKKGLVWSDGRPLTAQDFVDGVKRQLNPAVASGYAFTLRALEGAAAYNDADARTVSPTELRRLRDAVGVAAPDPWTVVYRLGRPSPWFLSVLATWNGLPAREDLITAGDAPEDNSDWTRDPARYVGNGPYRLTIHEPGSRLAFVANPRYARGAPPVTAVDYVMVKDVAVAFASYKAGNLDVIGPKIAGVNAEIKSAIDADPILKQEFQSAPGVCTVYLGLNTTIPPFDDVRVRRAFAAAFDRATFANVVLKGLGVPASQFLPPGVPGHYEGIPVQTFDPAGARRSLADAGFPGGKGLPAITVTYASLPTSDLIATAARVMFQENLGVTVRLDSIEPKAFSALTKQLSTTPQMFILGWCQDYPDPQDWYSTVFQSSATVSHTGWKNDRFDSLTRSADVETDPRKRDDLYRQAASILNTEAPVIFLYHNAAAMLIKPRVEGYRLDPLEHFFGQHSLYTLKLAPSSG